MDKKFGSSWHVVVGKGFSYEITYEVIILPFHLNSPGKLKQVKHILNVLVAGTTSVLLWKM